MRTKLEKYLPENQIWHKFDNFNSCEKQVLNCSICGHKGHYSEQLNQNHQQYQSNDKGKIELHLQVDCYIHHSHFIADLDRGRHVRCMIKNYYIPVSSNRITTMYRLDTPRNIPDWLKSELGYD